MTVTNPATAQPLSISLIRIIGYAFLAFALIDLIAILFPPTFKDAAWEFQTLGDIVERVPVPLMGFLFVFYGESLLRKKWEFLLLRILSWLALLLAFLCLLFVGLGLSATLRLNNNATLQVDSARSNSLTQIQRSKERLSEATDDQLSQLLQNLQQQNRSTPTQNVSELREQINQEFLNAEKTLKERSDLALKTQRKSLLKRSVKWNLAGIISFIVYGYVWKSSAWARGRKKSKKKQW